MGWIVTNKYNKKIYLPDHSGTDAENKVEEILRDLRVNYVKQFFFDEDGMRRIKYDFAVLDKEGRPSLLIEVDGPAHYSEMFYLESGVRPERIKAHVVKRCLGDAEKDSAAFTRGLFVLRVNSLYGEHVRDLIVSYIWKFVDREDKETAEVAMFKMMERYGWDFDYVVPSSLSKAEKAFLEEKGLI